MEQDKARYRAYVCCGPNCGPKGSSRLLGELEAEVERQALGERVVVLATGCQSHCESGPTMVVYPGPVYYQEVDSKRLMRIVAEHFAADSPVEEFFWTGYGLRWQRPSWQSRAMLPPASPSAQPHRAQAKKQPPRQRPNPDADDFKW